MIATESSVMLDGQSPILKSEKASSILMSMIRQEMVHQLMRANQGENEDEWDEEDEEEEEDDDGMSDLESQAYTEVSEIAEAMFAAVDTKSLAESVASGNFDDLDAKRLRSLLRSTLHDSKRSLATKKTFATTSTEPDDSYEPDNDMEPSNNSNTSERESEFALQRQGSKSAIEKLLESFAQLDYNSDQEEGEDEEDMDDDMSCMSDLTGLTSLGIDTKPRKLPTYSVTSTPADPSSSGDDDKSNHSGSTKMIVIEGIPQELSSSVGGSQARSAPRRKKVRFSQVSIRYYQQIVCDNPGISGGGPSIGFSWEYRESAKKRTVQEFEKERHPIRNRSNDLIMSKGEREFLVKKWGIEPVFITQMARSVQKTKAQRRQTANNIGAQKVEEAVEKVGRKFRKMFKRQQ